MGYCTHYTSADGSTKPLDSKTNAFLEQTKNQWSSEGKRVILLARKTVSRELLKCQEISSHFEDEILSHARNGLTLVGMVAIVDPPRDEIPSVVGTLRGAGIRIFMVYQESFQLLSNYTKTLSRSLAILL